MKSPYATIRVSDLQVGTYVIIPLSWHEHPFFKNQFLIRDAADIEQIRALGLREVQYDPSRSAATPLQAAVEPQPPASPSPGEDRQRKVTEELVTTIQDETLPPAEKASKVYAHSLDMMQNLLEHPTAENIRECKTGISAVVSLILEDNETLHYLLNITSHDYYTYTHSVEVGILSVALAKSLFKDSRDHDLHALGAGFFLHDLGKVYIDKGIINKPGRLTDEEMREMRRHPALGYKLLYETNQLTEESKTIVLQHHERNDGAGYPKGIRGEEIHIYGRICAIADVYDALTTNRPYREKMKPFAALKLMQNEMLHHFQRELFERFVLLFRAN